MIDTVLFDMGGTLEDIHVDDESRHASIQGVLDILRAHGIDPDKDFETAANAINAGWERYGAYRDPRQRELKPEEIWGSFVLTDFGLDEESVRSYAEELAHMWEVTHYHRALRPHVREMLEGLKDLGMKLGVISNTASLYQVFDILKEYGIRDYFQDVTLSSVTGYRKPNPNIFMVSLHQVQSDPAHCAYVGDTISRDVIGPIRMGFGATFHIDSYLTRLKDTHVSPDVKATYNIQDIYEVYTILKESH
ncbi:MAG: HAD family hydrolase [Oscillibacter sp.]|jgi:putative hydrolase of the HAD superfamily|nr:HAD family hydrolase [Dysosmobacter sp.]MDD6409464.1 HAD family hydrolase [Oscillibacter sp.]MDY3867445.1 HAD family hydrolase [Dysosmobacter sp.]